jgi:mannan endo-1,4-beta-mannosidase
MQPLLKAAAGLLLLLAAPLAWADGTAKPVTPNASPEAVALLQVLYDVSGRYILSGQHNYPNVKSRNSDFAAKFIGRTPVIWGTDWGHAKDGNTDSYLARPDIVQEAIRQNRLGSIVTLCWHAVPPTADEPITFQPLPGADPKVLKSVQGKLLDEQFRDVLTPGTELYKKWCSQVDEIAVFLKQLQDARVPVLWRPYHEMNGDWFWWGNRTGQYSTIALYKQMFDRLVNHHHLNNLIWVWSVDRPSRPGMEHEKFFPGIDFVDVLALDVYGRDFAQSYYDSLVALSQGKPLALAEVGNPPTPDVLSQQPRWTYYMTWSGMVRNTSRQDYRALTADARVLWLEDPAYWDVTAAYRKASGLQLLHVERPPADFTGTWVLDEDKSEFGKFGSGMAPARLEVSRAGNVLTVRTTRELEYADPVVSDDRLVLDGNPVQSEVMHATRETTAKLSPDGSQLGVETVAALPFGDPAAKMTTKETWTIISGGRQLSIERSVASPRGIQDSTLVFDKR